MKSKYRRLFVAGVILGCVLLMAGLVSEAPNRAQLRLMEYAREKKIYVGAYPDYMAALLQRNPEAEEFVLNYPFREEKSVDLAGYDASRGVPLFLQWDPQWGYMRCGGDCVGGIGSAPMCLAMAGFYASGGEKEFSPDRIVDFALENGYFSKENGFDRSLISQGGTALGLKVTALPLVEQKITSYLRNGDPIIAAMGHGDFDNYVVLTGYSEDMITLNDPDSLVNSEKLWTFDEIAGQIRNLWVVQKKM